MEKKEKYTLEEWVETYKHEKEERKEERSERIKKIGEVGKAQKKPRIWRNMRLNVLIKGIKNGMEEVIERLKIESEETVEIEITDDKLKTFFNRNNSLNGLILNKDNKYFEVLVSNLKLEDTISEIEDNNNKITYSLSPISEVYAASLLYELLTRYTVDGKKLRKIFLIFSSYIGRQKISIEKKESRDVNEYFYKNTSDNLISPVSLKIKINQEIGLEKLKEIINSFSFEYMYSKNKEIILSEDIYEAFKIKNETKNDEIISFHEKNIDTPLKYNSKLINFYRTGIKAEDPYIQYLSYYHILEYHYDRDLNKKVINELNRSNEPNTTAKNLIRIVRKGMDDKKELKSILKKYINDIQKLKDRIEEMSKDTCEYYKNNKVIFSSDSKINWNTLSDVVFSEITNRIYNTRNSLVHSKKDETEGFYEPWNDTHVKVLKKEIPLIRAVAELIIKNTDENIKNI